METTVMTLEEGVRRIRETLKRMNELYQQLVFNEWAVVALFDRKVRMLAYHGPRKDEFRKNFLADVALLKAELFNDELGFGDFDFARHAHGTQFDAFMVLGEGVVLICNHTDHSVDAIARNSQWLKAQRPFIELSESFRASPLVYLV